ncbi:hypothetical protein PWT90_10565 [Aphanocladium album]|nr:hypothetical protein PWT90_10565 [Aphanocladium album]
MASPFARAAIEFKTPRVLARTGQPSDAESFASYNRDAANFPYGGCQPEATADQAAKTIESFARWAAEGKHAWIFFFSRATGALMGYGGYNAFEQVDDADKFLAGPTAAAAAAEKTEAHGETNKQAAAAAVMADMGIMLDHRFWGQGYGLEIFVGLTEWARREMGAAVFRTETDLENQAWQALMRRAEVGECVHREKASYSKDKDVLQWRWDDEAWAEARRRIEAKGRWFDIE